MAAIPAAPGRGYSFTANSTNNPTSQQPGVNLDAEIDRTNGAVAGLIGAVSVSLNADGTLKSSAVQSAYAAAVPPAGSGGTNIADAPSAASALLAQAWAEYLPGPLPAATLAGTGVTGDHFSARYWANYADVAVSAFSNQLQAFTNAIIAATPSNGLAGVQLFTVSGNYPQDSLVVMAGGIYRANTFVPAGTFNPAQWTAVTSTGALSLGGGTLTGALTLAADPAAPLQPATKQYADAGDALALPKTGGTLTGAIVLAADPAAPLQPATKQYVDGRDALALPKSGGTMTGAITLSGAPTIGLHAATKSYVDAAAGAGRNRLDNGMMEVQQRGPGGWSVNGYGPDRWLVTAPNTPLNFAMIAVPNGQYGGRYCLSTTCSLAVNNSTTILQRIQSADSFDLAGQTVTVSFWAAAATTNGSYQVSVGLQYPTNGGDAWASGATAIGGVVNVPVTGSPTRFQVTFANLPAGVANGLQVAIGIQQLTTAGSATLNIGGVQMEVGATASALEKRPYQQEIARCMRFYQVSQVYLGGYAIAGVGAAQAMPFPVPMRVNPTFTITANSSTNLGSFVTGTLLNGFFVQGTVSGTGGYILNVAITLSAEL